MLQAPKREKTQSGQQAPNKAKVWTCRCQCLFSIKAQQAKAGTLQQTVGRKTVGRKTVGRKTVGRRAGIWSHTQNCSHAITPGCHGNTISGPEAAKHRVARAATAGQTLRCISIYDHNYVILLTTHSTQHHASSKLIMLTGLSLFSHRFHHFCTQF